MLYTDRLCGTLCYTQTYMKTWRKKLALHAHVKTTANKPAADLQCCSNNLSARCVRIACSQPVDKLSSFIKHFLVIT
jgi:hypothetical protein